MFLVKLKQIYCGLKGHNFEREKNFKWVGKGKKRKPEITYTYICHNCGKIKNDPKSK